MVLVVASGQLRLRLVSIQVPAPYTWDWLPLLPRRCSTAYLLRSTVRNSVKCLLVMNYYLVLLVVSGSYPHQCQHRPAY